MRRIQRAVAICLCMLVLAGTLPITTGTAALAEATGTAAIRLGSGALGTNVNSSAAATVYYGQYNGSPIAWRVIGYNGSGVSTSDGTSGKAMLLSSEKLGMSVFYSPDPSQQNNNYAQSALRTSISNIANGLTLLEQGAIAPRDLVAGSYNRMDPWNTDCIADPNNATLEDQLLWPLSTDEADDTDGNGVAESIRALNPEDTIDIDTDWWWWLRSPGDSNFAASVSSSGLVAYSGLGTHDTLGVRPAFYLNLSSVLFTSDAEGGKSSGAEGAGALAAISDSDSTEYKLTLRDSERNLQISGASDQTSMTPGGSVTVNYTGATTGTNEYISAMIVNETSGRPVYYGRIKSLASDSDASGNVTINVPAADNFSGGNYTLYVFNEQCNGDKMTDYSSAMIAVASMTVNYDVIYMPGELGTGERQTAEKVPGQALTLAGALFTRDGYTQTGWSLTDGGTQAYALNASYTANAPLTLYPVWTQNTYGISVSPDSIDFGSQPEGYESAPNAQTVTISNTGNQPITLTQPASTNNFTFGTLSSTDLAVNGTVTFTVQPNTGLGVGTYTEALTVSGSNNVSASVGLSFTVTEAPTYSISASPTSIDFGSLTEGYESAPNAQTVTITNTGNQPITLTQPASTNTFTFGTLSSTTLVVDGTVTFTVQPNTGLGVGTYTETLMVSGSNGSNNVSASVGLSFTVTEIPTYGISVSPDSIDFGSQTEGYTAPAAQTVTVTNTGNQEITLTQPASTTNFTVGELSTTTLTAGGTATLSVQPRTGLGVGTYTETLTISGSNGSNNVSACVGLTFTVTEIPTYGISVSPDSIDFGSQTEGYESAPNAQTVTITNTGNQPITLTQPTSTTNFTVGTLSSTDLAVNGMVTFTVQPNAGLGVGTYTDTLTVSGSNNTSANVALRFEVTVIPTYGISADPTSIDFGSQTEGYTAPAAQTVTIRNTGNQSITLTQPASTTNFMVDELSTTTLAAGGTATLSVQPRTGLGVGTYADTLIISGSNDTSASIGLTFTVTEVPTYGISADPTSIDFGSQTEGYTAPAAQTVTIRNTGNQSITLTQPTNTTNFTVGELSSTTLAVNGTVTFTVQPRTGLDVGTYTDTLIISGSNDTSASIGLAFTVTEAPAYGISADPTSLNFGSQTEGYAAPAAQTVTIRNTGNQSITLTQPTNTTNFTVGELSSTTLAVNGTVTFTVQPRTGLGMGAYTDTLIVSGSNDTGASIGLTFTVTEAPTYGISADPTSIDFGSQTEGYTAPAAQTVTISNTGNQSITLTQPASTTNFTVGELSTTTLAAGGTATLNVQPRTGLGVGTYTDTLIISGSNNVSASVGLAFTVTGAPAHAVTLNIRLDGAAYSGLTVALDATDSAATPAYALGESGAGAYTNNAVPAGTYYIYINGTYINRQFVNEQGGMWSMDYYTVRFDANGGTPAPESQIVLVGNAATEPVGVTMPDHTLEGWYNGEQRWDFASPVEQTLTLKANWTATAPQTYALTVVNGTGSGSYAAGAEVTIQADEAPTGMRFKEWQISPAVTFAQGGANTATATIVMPGSAVTAVAEYETVPTELSIAVQPVDQYIVEGQRATFTIAATGDGVTYQWYINRNDGRGWRALDGATGPAYATSVADLSCDGFQYACEVRDMYGNSLKSEIAVLHVSRAPVIPETGDSGRPGLYLAMLLAGGVGLIVLGKKRKHT